MKNLLIIGGSDAGISAALRAREVDPSWHVRVVVADAFPDFNICLRETDAAREGFAPMTRETVAWDHKAYYPGATQLRIRTTGDPLTGRLLGVQLIGHYGAEVSKRVDVFATALFHEMRVDGLEHVDLSYTPPLASPWDAVQIASMEWALGAPQDQAGQSDSRSTSQ